jgi:hypothetical protein
MRTIGNSPSPQIIINYLVLVLNFSYDLIPTITAIAFIYFVY